MGHRVCINFRKLNAQSRFDAYPMPRVDEFLEKIGQAKFITTLDLCKGYWQVPLSPASRPYTAFRTPLGLYLIYGLSFWPAWGTCHLPKIDGSCPSRLWGMVCRLPWWCCNTQQLLGRTPATGAAGHREDPSGRVEIKRCQMWVGTTRSQLPWVLSRQRPTATASG